MGSSRLSSLPVGLALGTLVAMHAGAAQADFISTGGTLTGVSPATVSAGASSFDATHTTNLPPTGNITDTSVSGSFGSQLTIDANAQTLNNGAGGIAAEGQATGTLGIDLSAPEVVDFNWSETTGPGYVGAGATGTLTLMNASGVVVLGCTVTDTFGTTNPGGCEAGAVPSSSFPPPGLLRAGSVDLAAGDYTLSLAVHSGANTSQPLNVGYQFQMSPVPLPPGLPLLVSGLAGLWVLTRRQRPAAAAAVL